MDEAFLDKYVGRRPAAEASPVALLDTEGEDSLGCFGWLRGLRERAPTLQLRKKDGRILAVGYAWLERMEYDPASGIALHAADRTFSIRGRNLNGETRPSVRLFEGLARHRVPWMQEADRATSIEAGGDATVIERIDW